MGATGYLLACMLMWGLAVFGMNLAGKQLDPMTVAAFNMFGYFLVGAIVFPQASFSLTWHHAIAVVVGSMFVLGNMAFYKLSPAGDVSTLAPLTGLYVMIPVVLGLLFLGEPLTLRKGAGAVLAGVAIYLLSSGK